ncbi:phospholipid-binding lipoprotein MlaA, partial [Escherichia coli]
MKYRLCGVALLVALLSGCASTPNNGDSRSDPLEGFNRQMFNFNYYVLDPYVL